MEVHRHTHTPRKKWTHYFWEFLMLFLAVFCGFLAENQREHMIERQREKQYMITMLEDLKADLPLLNSTMNNWHDVNKSIDSVTDAISFPIATIDLPKIYRHINEALNYWSFVYNDRTITQLKNSGGFRLVRNKTVANKIIAYDQFNNDAAKNIAMQHNKFFENVTAIRSRVLLEEIISGIHEKYNNKPPPLSINPWIDNLLNKNKVPLSEQEETRLMFELKNSLFAFKRDYDNMDWAYTQLQEMINELIKLIQANYQLKY
jgi:predicted MPP superfamily phosphohydrolase